jgi:hypothetical protein
MSHSTLPLLVYQMKEAVESKTDIICGYTIHNECFQDNPNFIKVMEEYRHNNDVWKCRLDTKIIGEQEYLTYGDIHPCIESNTRGLDKEMRSIIFNIDRHRKLSNYKIMGVLEPKCYLLDIIPKPK